MPYSPDLERKSAVAVTGTSGTNWPNRSSTPRAPKSDQAKEQTVPSTTLADGDRYRLMRATLSLDSDGTHYRFPRPKL